MYTNAPLKVIDQLPELFQRAIQSSRRWRTEREYGRATSDCLAALFPPDDKQDVTLSIWCSQDSAYELLNRFELKLVFTSDENQS